MSGASCPYDVGAPGDWVRNASLPEDAKACAVSTSEGCNDDNVSILNDCCNEATQSDNSSAQSSTWTSDSIAVCSLPSTASNETYQQYQNCVLNTPGRNGGFRCNDLQSINQGESCNSLSGVISAPVATTPDTQVCVIGARANASSVIEQCCGSTPISFEGGCWEYCVAPANGSVASCLGRELSNVGITGANIGCAQPSEGSATTSTVSGSSSSMSSSSTSSSTPTGTVASSSSTPSSGANGINGVGMGSTLGLMAVLAYAAGLL